MANLWDSLDDEQRKALVDEYTAGKRTPENISRAKEQLAANPNLVKRLAKEAGIEAMDEDAVMQDAEDVGEASDIDAAVDASLEESGDVQEVGSVPRTANAGLEEKIRRLEEENRRLRGAKRPREELNPLEE